MSRDTKVKSKSVAGVQPEMLRWARTTTGLTVDDVATTLKRPSVEIESWETGATAPTYAQLEKLAYDIYKRPLAIFFLPTPPQETMPQVEFRTLPALDMQSLARDTYLHIRKAHAYQLALLELFNGHNPAERCITKELRLTLAGDMATQAQGIRDFLGITQEKQCAWKKAKVALEAWRNAIEDAGVFIFKASFKQKEMAGFCLVDAQLPIIYLNNSVTKTRQIFSLLHELTHLLLNMNGMSKIETSYIEHLPSAQAHIERFCDAMTAEVLMPNADFAIQARSFPSNVERSSDEQFAMLASRYGVSREVVLRRFKDLGRASQAFYDAKAKFWEVQIRPAKGGGDYYATQGAYISKEFTKEIISRHYRQQLTLEQAADYLGIKAKNFAGFEENFLKGASA